MAQCGCARFGRIDRPGEDRQPTRAQARNPATGQCGDMIGEEIGPGDPEDKPPLPCALRMAMLVLAHYQSAWNLWLHATEPTGNSRVEAHARMSPHRAAPTIGDELDTPRSHLPRLPRNLHQHRHAPCYPTIS